MLDREDLIAFLKEKMTIEVEGRAFDSAHIVIKIDNEKICETPIRLSDLKEYNDY